MAGGLIDGIKKLVNAEGLVLDNISMYEDDAKKLGNFSLLFHTIIMYIVLRI